ncbi:MAG TPA: hypothetical protein VGF75_00035, partial [Candidatus Saccharimonadales bacterium]|jgi:hypothetical protein
LSTTFPSLNLDEFGSSIANAEGYGVPGAVPTIANNPGDLELGDVGFGVTSAANGNEITNFPTAQAGADALTNQENLIANGNSSAYTSGESLSDFANTYSGGSQSFLQNIESYLGVGENTSLSSLLGAAGEQALGVNPIGTQLTGAGVAGGSSLTMDVVFIVLGIVLIGIGALSFKGTQTIIETVGSTAARVAT